MGVTGVVSLMIVSFTASVSAAWAGELLAFSHPVAKMKNVTRDNNGCITGD